MEPPCGHSAVARRPNSDDRFARWILCRSVEAEASDCAQFDTSRYRRAGRKNAGRMIVP